MWSLLSEVSQDRMTDMWYYLYVESKNDTDELIYTIRSRLTDRENKFMVGNRELEVGIN